MPRFTPCILALTIAASGCALNPPPSTPEDARTLERARRQSREADAERSAIEQEHVAASTAIEAIEREIAALDEPHEAAQRVYREQALAYESYTNRVEAALVFARDCDQHSEALSALETGVALAGGLAEYVSEPQRDDALAAMDRCRKQLLLTARKIMKEVVADLQKEFAVEVEDLFDEANPYSRGDLTAKVEGSTLKVRMRGNFEGRARYSQDQVDAWCERASGLFTKITLNNSHGTFTCVPDESPRDLVERLLTESGASSTWVVVGVRAIPTPAGDPPTRSPDAQRRRAELVTELDAHEAELARLEGRATKTAELEQSSQQMIARVDRQQQQRTEAWRQHEIAKASATTTAGGVILGIGGAVLVGTLGAWQTGLAGTRDFVPIGVGVSVPVMVTGILLIVGGSVRKNRVRQPL
ncbi:MAG TPA: hypothetical protein VM869_33935 [Enhygromyxa sp.]|nr:hypothetical protein [Enhygromyxa sp.]